MIIFAKLKYFIMNKLLNGQGYELVMDLLDDELCAIKNAEIKDNNDKSAAAYKQIDCIYKLYKLITHTGQYKSKQYDVCEVDTINYTKRTNDYVYFVGQFGV
jgi:transcriptional regulatory protein LevR